MVLLIYVVLIAVLSIGGVVAGMYYLGRNATPLSPPPPIINDGENLGEQGTVETISPKDRVDVVVVVGKQPDSNTEPEPTTGDDDDGIDVNSVAALIHKKINEERQKADMNTLQWNDKLASVALAHSQDMADKNYYSHASLDGKTYQDRYKAAGIVCTPVYTPFERWTQGAENLEKSNGYSTSNEELADSTIDSWMNSIYGHRGNILTPGFTSEGIGVVVLDDVYDTAYVTQNFC